MTKNKKVMKTKFNEMTFKGILKYVLGVFGICCCIVPTVCGIYYSILVMSEKNYSYEIYKSNVELSYYVTKDKLIECIDNYIRSNAETSVMNGFAFIDVCDKYQLDLKFVIAQAQVEGAFATKGIAAKTNSAFNVRAYDGRSATDMIKKGHSYKHPDQSIEPYAKLLTESYLVNGKTEMDMMNSFVNKDGKRYASSKDYEKLIRNAYARIGEETNFDALYREYLKYKIISGH